MRDLLLSPLYRLARRALISSMYLRQEDHLEPRDLEEAIERGDRILPTLPGFLRRFSIPEGIAVRMYDLSFPSPLVLASFKEDLGVIAAWLDLGLGGAVLKTVLPNANSGNPRPRIAEVVHDGRRGFLNSVGLQGEGAYALAQALQALQAERARPSSLLAYGRPIGLSIGGNCVAEYAQAFRTLEEGTASIPDLFYEINASCPNTPRGQELGEHPELVHALLAYMRDRTPRVIGVKCSPDWEDKDLLGIADVTKGFARTFLDLGNTKLVPVADHGLPAEGFTALEAGLSGPALYPRTLAMVRLVRKEYCGKCIPLIATGGVDSAEKVRELQDAGAQLVGMASAIVSDMYCVPRINRALAKAAR